MVRECIRVMLGWGLLFLVLGQIIAACSSDQQLQDAGRGLAVLTLNLHTYQEHRDIGAAESALTDELALRRIEAYGPIFDRIAAGIGRLDPDIICFQEVGEWLGSVHADPEVVEFGATNTNMVHQIISRLGNGHYNNTMDWSHYGWNVWLEGSAILSKYPLRDTESQFISNPENGAHEFWKSRNVPMAKLDVPDLGDVAVFSVHAGWWDDPEEPFQDQYRRLLTWAAQATESASVTILCGDFNVPAAGAAYSFMTKDTGYLDQYVLANPDGMLDATIGGAVDGWEANSDGQRIDYILMNDDSPLKVTRARRVFTEEDLGRVSDHVGVYAEFVIPPTK